MSGSVEFKKQRMTAVARFQRLNHLWSFIIVASALFAGLFALSSSHMRDLERRMTWEALFRLRESVNRSPKLDERIRVLMFDDSSVQAFKKSSINFREWAALFTFLESYHPATIYVDKIFGLLDDETSSLYASLPALRMLRTRVSVGAFTHSQKIPSREPLDLDLPQFQARRYLPDSISDVSEELLKKRVNEAGLKDRSTANAYGPLPELRSFFHQGHIDYPTTNHVFPMYTLSEDKLLPSLALSGRINLKIEQGGLVASGVKIPILPDGSVLVNWLNPARVYESAIPFTAPFDAIRKGEKWDRLPAASHVVILPLAYTGNSDFKDSPYGQVPGGMVQISVLNSALSGQWLSELPFSKLVFIISVLLVGLVQFIRGAKAWLVLLATVCLVVFSGVCSFVWLSYDSPWMACALIDLSAGVAVLSLRSRWEQKRENLMNQLERDYAQLETEEQRLAKELKDAARIAQALNPEPAPEWPKFVVSGFYKSISEASGDWYFFETSQSGRYGHFVLCDITGHGVQAALVVSSCKTVLSMMRAAKDSIFESTDFLQEYASRLNKILFSHGHGSHSTTLIGLTFDFHTNKMYCINCGHPFPILHSIQKGEKTIAFFAKVGDPIGYLETLETVLQVRDVLPGDCVIAHSDGLPLSRNRRILSRYFEELDNGLMISAQRLHDAFWRAMRKQSGEGPSDDASVVVFKRVS